MNGQVTPRLLEAFRLASHKLPVATKLVVRGSLGKVLERIRKRGYGIGRQNPS